MIKDCSTGLPGIGPRMPTMGPSPSGPGSQQSVTGLSPFPANPPSVPPTTTSQFQNASHQVSLHRHSFQYANYMRHLFLNHHAHYSFSLDWGENLL